MDSELLFRYELEDINLRNQYFLFSWMRKVFRAEYSKCFFCILGLFYEEYKCKEKTNNKSMSYREVKIIKDSHKKGGKE